MNGLDCVLESSEDKLPSVSLCDDEMFSSASSVPCVSVAVAWWYWPTGSCIADLEDTVGKLLALTASDSGALSGIPPVSSKSSPSQFTAAFASPAIRLLGYNL